MARRLPGIPTARQIASFRTRRISATSVTKREKTPEERLDELEKSLVRDDPEAELFRSRRRRRG